jgi:predicted MarR family transcription regulator
MATEDVPLPKPDNRVLSVIKIVLDALIKGLGVEFAITAATAKFPWLGLPVIRSLFKWLVQTIAAVIDERAYNYTAVLVIRFQNNLRRDDYERAIRELIFYMKPEDLENAKKAIDRLVNRSK